MFKVAPLTSSFMLVSMFGFIISAFFVTHPIYRTWAWAFLIVFVIMFISSMISMSKTPIGNIETLSIHEPGHYKKKK